MKHLLMAAALLAAGFTTTTARAMDDTERARQLELYRAQQSGGAIVTHTAGSTPSAAASPARPAGQMAPLADDGTPLDGVAPMAETLGSAAASSAAPAITVTTAEDRKRQLEAYEAYRAGRLPRAAGQEPAAAPQTLPAGTPVPIPADATAVTIVPGPTTTTTEKTTTTSYTVTTRKVGLVGNRPYQAKTAEIPGGVTREVTVNGELAAQEIVVPDTIDALKTEKAEGDYYSNRRAARVYQDGNVKVHNTGRLNR